VGTQLLELGAVLIGLAVLARTAARFGLPAIPLYLLAGLAFGEGGFLPLVSSHAFVETGAEIGLILLLFTLGLEYSATELLSTMRRSASSGVVDAALNFVPGLVGGLVLGWGVVPSLFLGGVTYVTSSGITARLLAARSGESRPEAPTVLSILILEDLAMALYLPVLAALLIGGLTLRGLGSILVALAVIAITLTVAVRFDAALSRLLFSRSDEALVLTLVGFALVIAGLAERVNVSAGVGALLAGILVSGPAARGAHALLSPLRDLFAALFFVFIGLSVDPASIPHQLVPAGILAALGIGTKLLTGWYAIRRSRVVARGLALRTGAMLVPRGEFSLAIAALGAVAGIEPNLAPLAVTYVLILAIVGPVLAKLTDRSRGPRRRGGRRSLLPPG
jgi:CPA2 family monovalent cation:H+ antiporter-2